MSDKFEEVDEDKAPLIITMKYDDTSFPVIDDLSSAEYIGFSNIYSAHLNRDDFENLQDNTLVELIEPEYVGVEL
jgi:hypothetical protein